MDLHAFLFWTVALLTGLSAVSVVVTQNIVRSAAWLLFALGGTAGLFFLLGADFVGATQLIVYVGGTLVLVVFGVMLTAQGPFISIKTSAAEWGIATVVGLVFFGVLVFAIVALRPWPTGTPATPASPADSMSSVALGESLLGVTEATPEAKLTGIAAPKAETPQRRQMSYLLPFEIVSVHLLVVLIGAAYLARAKRRKVNERPPVGS
jgi:NADH:ubiquinone oxidoreductase subunit 6 (subunit J)